MMGRGQVPLFPVHVERSEARFSPCRTWRYTLHRIWRPGPLLMVVGLNPSTADEARNDPTVTRCVNLARRLFYGGLIMANAFAIRGTDPAVIARAGEQGAVGPDNDFWVRRMANEAKTVLVAWGNHGLRYGRQQNLAALLADKRLWCLGATKQGAPRHPLYLPNDTRPEVFAQPRFEIAPGQEDDGYPD